MVGLLAAFVVAIAWSSTAKASPRNPITEMPRTQDGPGIKVGERSSFHPGFALAVGYDSNVFYVAPSGEGQRQQAAFATPSAWLGIGNRKVRDGILDSPAKRTVRKVDYYFGAHGAYRVYMSGNEFIRQAGKFNVGAIARVNILPGRRFETSIDEDFTRLAEPRSFEAGSEFNFNRLNHNGALRFTIRPGGGRLSLMLAYRSQLLAFERADIDHGNRVVNGGEHETKFRFRDRSAIAARYSFHHTFYYGCCSQPGTGRNEDSHAHRATAGYTGQVGRKWAIDAFAGWGWGLYRNDADGPDHSMFIGHLQVAYYPRQRTEIRVRGERQFYDSLFGNFYADSGGSIAFNHTFKSRTFLDLGASVYQRRTEGLPIPGQDTTEIGGYRGSSGFVRNDILIAGRLQLEQPLGKFVVVGARYVVASDVTDHVTEFVNGTEDIGRWNRHMAMALVAVRY